MKSLEEEDELKVLRNLLKGWANRGDGDELSDVEQKREGENGDDVMENDHPQAVSTALFLEASVFKRIELDKSESKCLESNR